MLDTSKLPRSFSAPFGEVSYDFVVTGVSDEASLKLNVARADGEQRLLFGNGLAIDRHAGHFHFADELAADMHRLRPWAMKLNAVPAKLLGAAWRVVGGIIGAGPKTFFIGGGDFGLVWNLTMLAILIALFAFAATIGIYVVAPLLLIAVFSFILEMAYFKPAEEQRAKDFMDSIAKNVLDLVETTVSH